MNDSRGWRRRLALLAMAAFAVALACNAEITLVEIDHAESLPLPAELAGQPFDDVELDTGEGFDPLDSPELEEYGGTAAAIGDAAIVEATLEALGAGRTLDFLDSIQFYVKAPGMQQRLLAEQHDIPAGKKWVALEVNPNLDLTDFIDAGTIQPVVVVSGVGPDEETELEVAFVMELGVSVADTCAAIFD